MWANRAKKYVDIFKKAITKDLKASNSPLVLWCYFAECSSKIINATACDNYHLNGETTRTLMTDQPMDISAIYLFYWYNWFYYQYQAAKFPNSVNRLRRVLCPVYHAITAMSQWLMNDNGTVVPGQTLHSLNIFLYQQNYRRTKAQGF